MIKISELTDGDVGRNVIYMSGTSFQDVGRLSSWNDQHIFVNYRSMRMDAGLATRPEDLEFEEQQDG